MKRLLAIPLAVSVALVTVTATQFVRRVHAQAALANQGNTGLPAPMLYGNNDPVSLGYACSTTINLGVPYYNFSPSGTLPLWICNGTGWTQAKPAIIATTASIGGSLIALGGYTSGVVSVTGIVAGQVCLASPSDGSFPNPNVKVECATQTGQVTVRETALAAATPTAVTFNVRIFQ